MRPSSLAEKGEEYGYDQGAGHFFSSLSFCLACHISAQGLQRPVAGRMALYAGCFLHPSTRMRNNTTCFSRGSTFIMRMLSQNLASAKPDLAVTPSLLWPLRLNWFESRKGGGVFWPKTTEHLPKYKKLFVTCLRPSLNGAWLRVTPAVHLRHSRGRCASHQAQH